ncbi:MAG: amino acid racemase [Bacilli bacterium]|nr:amino acid racemase [Bacilli bacterium]
MSGEKMEYVYDLGIIGGMGPEATAEIFKRIIDHTKAFRDQDHMKICVLNNTSIPDRTAYIENKINNPLPKINEAIRDLITLKTRCFIIACNTAHYFEDMLVYDDRIKFFSIVSETLDYINKFYPTKKVYILGTNGTKNAMIYSNNPHKGSLDITYPEDNSQKMVMKAITDTKNGTSKNEILTSLKETIKEISNGNMEYLFVLACTELSLYKNDLEKDFFVLDAMDILIEKVITECGYELK